MWLSPLNYPDSVFLIWMFSMKYCVGREGRDSRGNICFRNIKWTQKCISTGEPPCYTDEEFENQSRVESHLGYVRLFLSLVVMLRIDEQHSHPWSWGSLAAGEVGHSQQAEPEEEVMWQRIHALRTSVFWRGLRQLEKGHVLHKVSGWLKVRGSKAESPPYVLRIHLSLSFLATTTERETCYKERWMPTNYPQ